jgi:hypothetical protein
VVALLQDSLNKELLRGQVGTLVETLAPGVFEVEFGDDNGQIYATRALYARTNSWGFTSSLKTSFASAALGRRAFPQKAMISRFAVNLW